MTDAEARAVVNMRESQLRELILQVNHMANTIERLALDVVRIAGYVERIVQVQEASLAFANEMRREVEDNRKEDHARELDSER